MTARITRIPLFASALLALLAAPATAAEVSAKDAARAATAWVDRGYALGKLPAGREVAGVDEIEDSATGARLRVVRFEGGGFVVLSADDLVDPVLAFSETGDGLDLDDGNPFWALLRGDIAAREAAAGVKRGEESDTKGGETATRGAKSAEPTAAQGKWAALLSDAAPSLRKGSAVAVPSDLRVDSFVQSRWNQTTASAYSGTTDYCYNYYTPNHYHSGCVATALSQIMWYFRSPTGWVTPTSYPCRINGNPVITNMIGGVYDWASMPARPWETGTTEAQRAAIGKIVYDVGVTVGMNWTAFGSSSSALTGQSALMEDFGYAQACAVPYLSDENPWSLETFRSNVVPCLDARSPVALSIGVSTNANQGHAVIADGYGYSDGAFYIHVNFGWGYSQDSQTAWYCPPDLKTDYDFDLINGILCNISTDRTGSIFSGRVLDKDGNPVSGATVQLLGRNQLATTDANGIYAFFAPAGSYTAFAYKDGASASVEGVLRPTLTVTPTGRTGAYSWTPGSVSCGNSPDNDIVLNGLESAPAPVFDPVSCLFYPMTNVTISCPDAGVAIYYTIDGSTPTENSFFYSGPDPQSGLAIDNGPITVSDTVTIKARAFSPGKNASPVVSETYTYDAAAGGPKGDFFARPIGISGTNGTYVIADTTDYTLEDDEPNHSGYWEYLSIWYLWTAPGSGTMTFRTHGLGDYYDPTAVAVYTGDSLSALSKKGVASDADYEDPDFATTLEVSVEQGTTYRIVGVVCYDDYGTFTLEWSGDLTVAKTPYEEWAESPDVNLGGPTEVTGGVANLFRYVFDRPTGSFSPILSALPGPSDGSVLQLSPVLNTNGVTLKVVSTTNVADWSNGTVDRRVIQVAPGGGTVNLPVGGPARFFRLEAKLDENAP